MKRIAALSLARMAIRVITAELKVSRALRSKFTPATVFDCKTGDRLNFTREGNADRAGWSKYADHMERNHCNRWAGIKTFGINEGMPTACVRQWDPIMSLC